MAQQHKFYAIVLPGLEKLAAEELRSLSAHDIDIEYGGINFTGTMQLLYRVNLRSRIITRVLMRLRTFRSMTLEGLRYDLEKVAWHLFLDQNSTLEVQVNSKQSRLNHSDEIAAFSKQTLQRILPKLGSTKDKKHIQTLHIRIENNRGILSIDTSGERLDRRGYRLESGKAPLRETLAAAILQWTNWQPEQSLVVPMCGSGTFVIEAAMLAKQQAPNIKHDFSFLHWPSFKDKEFNKVVERSQAMEKDVSTHLIASDLHEGAVEICQSNAKRAGLEKMIAVSKLDVHHLIKPESIHGGILLLNPPYGQRIGEQQKILSLWHDLGNIIREKFGDDETWKAVIVCPDSACEKALNLNVKRRLHITHGGSNAMVLEA